MAVNILAALQIVDDEHFLYQKLMILSYIWKGIIFCKQLFQWWIESLINKQENGQIWTTNLFLTSTKQWLSCAHPFQKLRTSANKPWRLQLRKLLRTNFIRLKQLKQTSWIFLSKHECFIQEGNHHILWELKLRKVFPAVHLANVGVVDLYQGVSAGDKGCLCYSCSVFLLFFYLYLLSCFVSSVSFCRWLGYKSCSVCFFVYYLFSLSLAP